MAQLAQELELLPGHRVRASGRRGDRAGRAARALSGRDPRRRAPRLRAGAAARAVRCASAPQDFELAFDSAPARRRARAPRRSGPRAARLARGRGLRRARGRRARAAARGLARALRRAASRTCSPRAASAARCRAARCRIWRACAMRSKRRARPASRRCARWSTASTALPARAAARGPARARCAPTRERGVDWLCFLRDAGLGACSPTTWASARRCRRCARCAGARWSWRRRSVLLNWAEEIARFRPGLRASLYHGPGRALDPEADVTLTSYALLRLDAEVLAQVALGHRRPRRGADDQEPGQPGRARRVPARRRRSA